MWKRSLWIVAALASGCASMPMTSAVDTGNGAELTRQLSSGADPNAFDDKGVTPLAYAAYRGRADMAEELLSHGARVDQPIKGGQTPQLIAVWNGHLNVVNVLLKHGAVLTAAGNGGTSALMRAIQKGRLDVVRELIKLGADVNEANAAGDNPIRLATYTNHPDIVSALVAAGAKPIGVQGRVGIAIMANQAGQLVIAQAVPGSPAALAGLKAGDKLLEIDGQTTEGLTVPQAVARTRGEPGASIDLTVERAAQGRLSFHVVRDSVGVGAAPAGTLPPPATKGEWWQQ